MTLPEQLGRYEILGELGKGAMGVVYLARDPIIDRQLAVKVFRMARGVKERVIEQYRERFVREAQAAGRLENHPNIVGIYDIKAEGEEYFIFMEYVKGIDLKQRLLREEKLDLETVIDITAQIADGLASAHDKNVVHRDVKPANILITTDGRVKITDFGVARFGQSNLTVKGQLLGTPNYMAPEQIQGEPVDARTDIFSLGVMLYEMLTGRKPFKGESFQEVSHRIVFGEPTPPEDHVPEIPAALSAIVFRALAKDPAERYQDAAEMARDLRAVRETPAPVPNEPSAPPPLPARPPTPAPATPAPPAPVTSASPTPVTPAAPDTAASPPISSSATPTPASLPPAEESSPPAEESAAEPSWLDALSDSPVSTGTDSIASDSWLDGSSSAPSSTGSSAVPAPSVPAPTPTAPAPTPTPTAPAPTPTAPTPTGASSPASPGPQAIPRPLPPSRDGTRSGIPGPAKLAAGILLFVVAIGGAALWLGRGSDPPPSPLPPSLAALEDPYLSRAAATSDGEQALAILRQGMEELPQSARLGRRYLDTALAHDPPRDILEVYVEERMTLAEQFLEEQDYDTAYEVLERVLFVAPEHEMAREISDSIDSRRQRRQRQARRAAPPPTPPPATVAPPAAPPSPPPPVRGELRIEFRTVIAEGKVRVTAAGQTLLDRAFDFPNRRTFRRKYLGEERGFEEIRALDAGEIAVQVTVEVNTRDGWQTLNRQLQGNLPADGTRVLRASVTEGGQLELRFE